MKNIYNIFKFFNRSIIPILTVVVIISCFSVSCNVSASEKYLYDFADYSVTTTGNNLTWSNFATGTNWTNAVSACSALGLRLPTTYEFFDMAMVSSGLSVSCPNTVGSRCWTSNSAYNTTTFAYQTAVTLQSGISQPLTTVSGKTGLNSYFCVNTVTTSLFSSSDYLSITNFSNTMDTSTIEMWNGSAYALYTFLAFIVFILVMLVFIQISKK